MLFDFKPEVKFKSNTKILIIVMDSVPNLDEKSTNQSLQFEHMREH